MKDRTGNTVNCSVPKSAPKMSARGKPSAKKVSMSSRGKPSAKKVSVSSRGVRKQKVSAKKGTKKVSVSSKGVRKQKVSTKKGPARPRSNRNDGLYNSFSQRQLNDLINDWLEKGTLVPYYDSPTCGENKVYRCTLATGTSKYAQAHLKRALRDKWESEGQPVPTAQKILVHAVFWRWLNNCKPLVEGLEISHCWKDRSDILYVCQESPEMNESRKYCMMFDWWHPKNRPYYKCNHHPPCWGDINKLPN